MNRMQEKIIAALRNTVENADVQWLEISGDGPEGTVYVQPADSFQTLLKLEYEFGRHECRLLIYRGGAHEGGCCAIRYDDGNAIARVMLQFESILAHALGRPSGGRINRPRHNGNRLLSIGVEM
jgi:hypothetical protein